MPSKWTRLLYSLISVVLAVLVISFVVAMFDRRATGPFTLEMVFPYWLMILCFSLPGWLLAVPIVLAVTNLRSWHFWALLALGCCIGPLLVLAASLTPAFANTGFSGHTPAKGVVLIAAGVSSLTTAIYLVLLRRREQALLR